MDEAGYQSEAHKKEHKRMLTEAPYLRKKFFAGGEAVVLQSLKNWLISHIQHADKEFADFLFERRQK